jgi:hypothetical protein
MKEVQDDLGPICMVVRASKNHTRAQKSNLETFQRV